MHTFLLFMLRQKRCLLSLAKGRSPPELVFCGQQQAQQQLLPFMTHQGLEKRKKEFITKTILQARFVPQTDQYVRSS